MGVYKSSGGSGGLDPLVWTAARASNLDNLDSLISTAGKSIKNVQRGSATIGAWLASVNVTVAAVVMSKSFLRFSDTIAGVVGLRCRGTLTTISNITFILENPNVSITTIEWELIEFN